MTTIIEKIRGLINDNLANSSDFYTYESRKVFTLTESNVSASTVKLFKNGTEVVSTGNWTYSATTNKITYTAALVAGDLIEITYSAYRKYSDNELTGYIKAAITYLSVYKYKTFTARADVIIPTPTEAQENLIALIASIIIMPAIKSYRTPELTIVFAEGINKEEKIDQSISQYAKCLGMLDYNAIQDVEYFNE